MDSSESTVRGGCHCGAVTYSSPGPVLRTGVCTCTACRKATGALESPNLGVPVDTFEVFGAESTFESDSSEDCAAGVFHFCAGCGTPLYWTPQDRSEIAIFAGSLDDTAVFSSRAGG